MTQYILTNINTSIDMDTNFYTQNNYFVVDCTAGNINISLPTAMYDGLSYFFNRVDSSSNTLTLVPKTGATVNNTTSISVPVLTTVEVTCFGTNFLAPLTAYTI